jgi:hypothetical protein
LEQFSDLDIENDLNLKLVGSAVFLPLPLLLLVTSAGARPSSTNIIYWLSNSEWDPSPVLLHSDCSRLMRMEATLEQGQSDESAVEPERIDSKRAYIHTCVETCRPRERLGRTMTRHLFFRYCCV